MPRKTTSRSLAPTALHKMLKRLDAARTKIAEMTKDADRQAKEVLAAMKRDGLDNIYFDRNRKAKIVTPDEITTDAAKFREIALVLGVDAAVVEACFTLSRERAADVIGQTKLEECTTRKPGKAHITFTGRR